MQFYCKNILVGIFFIVFVACGVHIPNEITIALESLPEHVDFNQHVKPILSDKCFSCHGPDENKLKVQLRLDVESIAKGSLPENEGKRAIVERSLNNSELFHRIISHDPEAMMPPPDSKLELSDFEKAVLVRWINQGAEYADHWAFIKPEVKEILSTNLGNDQNAIDHFISNKLKNNDLSFSPEAQKELLLRRVGLDLTGLPPSIQEIDEFLNDNSENAYEKQVDRLLSSPHYGEKMAADWMDIARFADTHGYQSDRFRDVSPWRDWVIKSFNENLSYEQFIIWQIAGDLLPNPTREQRLATAFLRLHPQNEEGGIVEEEFRVEYVADRVNTIGTAFMAMTLGCAKCHNHKFDPVTQKNYYELFSFFNNVNEAGQISFNGAMPVPTMLLTDEKSDSILAFIQNAIQEESSELAKVSENEAVEFNDWLKRADYKKLKELPYSMGMRAHFQFDRNQLRNELNPIETAKMQRVNSKDEKPVFTEGYKGKGLLLDGDSWLDLGEVGKYRRSDPFTMGIWVWLPKELHNGVIFHKGSGAALYNFKGFHLALKKGRLEVLMACTAPNNAIIELSDEIVPKEEWVHLALTYNGSSKASGLKAFLNGEELETSIEVDNLYKDIDMNSSAGEPVGIQIGARWRGKGIGGAKVDNILVFDRQLSNLEVLRFGNTGQYDQLISKNIEDLNVSEKHLFREYFLLNKSSRYKTKLLKINHLRNELNVKMEDIPELMVMEEMQNRRDAYVLGRGQYDAHLEKVFPNTPENILAMPENLPRNRLGLAKWLLHRDHPLTARVAANRYWQNYFGRGLVKTSEDFGNQGERPSHPALLDWLAVKFIDSGWNIKALQKLIVMSRTYRQSSTTSEELRARDPENLLLARGPSTRLSAEMIRDNILTASGLINLKIGGPSVFPYQPEGLWKVNNRKYEQSTGGDLYRRSLYTVWKRSVPHPTQATFDSPERSECTTRRQKTNTPLQALVLMNDPAFIEASRHIGKRLSETGDIAGSFRQLTGRSPNDDEVALLEELYERSYVKFKNNNAKIVGWINVGETSTANTVELEQIAANAVLANTIMNSDAFIVKR